MELRLMNKIDQLFSKIESQERKIESQDRKIESQGRKIEKLEEENKILKEENAKLMEDFGKLNLKLNFNESRIKELEGRDSIRSVREFIRKIFKIFRIKYSIDININDSDAIEQIEKEELMQKKIAGYKVYEFLEKLVKIKIECIEKIHKVENFNLKRIFRPN